MLKSIILQRFMALLNAVVFGFIIDRLTHSFWYGVISALLAVIVGLFLLSNKGLLKVDFGFGRDLSAIIRSTVLAIFFFIECAVAAWLILI